MLWTAWSAVRGAQLDQQAVSSSGTSASSSAQTRTNSRRRRSQTISASQLRAGRPCSPEAISAGFRPRSFESDAWCLTPEPRLVPTQLTNRLWSPLLACRYCLSDLDTVPMDGLHRPAPTGDRTPPSIMDPIAVRSRTRALSVNLSSSPALVVSVVLPCSRAGKGSGRRLLALAHWSFSSTRRPVLKSCSLPSARPIVPSGARSRWMVDLVCLVRQRRRRVCEASDVINPPLYPPRLRPLALDDRLATTTLPCHI